MFSPKFTLLLAAILSGAYAASFDTATVAASCISVPDDACASVVRTCVAGIVSGEVSASEYMSDRACADAVTCAGVDSVFKSACCAGTCLKPTDLDYNNVLRRDVGDDECDPPCPYGDPTLCVEPTSLTAAEEDDGVRTAKNTTVTADGVLTGRAIVPDMCAGPVDTPSTLPTLRYYCNLLPNICANIRAHPDFSGNSIVLTYDPFTGTCGRRRNEVCSTAVKTQLQNAGKCDKKQHNPAYWKVSCDEFPFNSSLEGGSRNARVMGVPTREQQYQGTLQASIVYLRGSATDRKTIWKRPAQCHKYKLELLNAAESGAPAQAVGSLDSGSTFFGNGLKGKRFITDRRAEAIPPPTTTDVPYPPNATNILVPGNSKGFDCTR